jgi:hypothetical protein
MTQPVRMQRCEDWTYTCPPVSSPTVMRTSRTAESLDDERTPADNQPPVAPQYHAASIDLLRQALCPSAIRPVGFGWPILLGPVVGAFGAARRASRSTENSASRAPSMSVALAQSSWPVGQEEVRATTSLSTADAPPHLARPAQQVGCYRASSR